MARKEPIIGPGKDRDPGELFPPAFHTDSKYADEEVELTRRIFDVVGSIRAPEWMHTEVPSLQNRTPLSLMKTPEGREEVERILGRIEHGIF